MWFWHDYIQYNNNYKKKHTWHRYNKQEKITDMAILSNTYIVGIYILKRKKMATGCVKSW